MASSNKGLVAVLSAGAAAAIGFAAFYTLVLAPRGEAKAAQSEVEQWGERWLSARDCLVGASPRSQDPFEALILREALGPDPIHDLALCLDALKGLKRDNEFSSGNEDLETKWSEVKDEIKKLAKAHAWRTASEPARPIDELRSQLARTILWVDVAYAALRKQADLEPMVYEGGGRLDALGDGVLIVGPNGKALDASMPLVIGDTLIFQGHDDSSDYFGRATGLKKIQLRALGTENTAAAADTLWAMWSEPVDDDGKITHLVAGPVGSDGEPTGEAHELARIKTDKGQLTPIFGLGEGEVRVVVYHHRVYEVPSIVWVVRSRDGGKTWPERFKVPHEAPRVEEDWSRRRIDISWNRSGTVMWLGIVASNLEGELKPRRLAANLPRSWSWQRRTCVGPTKAWWSLDKVLYSVDDEAITPLSGSHGDHDFLHCDDERIVALSSEYGDDPKVKLTLCDRNGCKGSVSVPNVAGSRYVSGYGATIGPLVAVILDGILIVWAGDPKKNESFDVVYTGRLPDTYRLSGLVEWDGKLVAVISDGDALRLLLVPLAR